MLITRKQPQDSWDALSDEEKAAAEADRLRQIEEDLALEEYYRQEHERQMNTPAPPGSPRKLMAASDKVVFRVRLASRPKMPILWWENEAGDRWIQPFGPGEIESPPPGYIYQWSRFPTVLREHVLRMVVQEEVDACPHPAESIKPDLGIIDSMEGRECEKCHGYQSKNKGEPWPEKWEANGSRDFMATESTWSPDLVLAMVRPSEDELAVAVQRHGEEPRLLGMDDAILMAATSCERCLNALLWRYGCNDGYPPYSEQWNKSNTRCGICKTPGVWRWLLNEKPAMGKTASNGHYTELCRECGAVISQCRCMSPDKEIRYGLCDACAGKQQPVGEPAIWHRITTVEELQELGRTADPAMLAEVQARSKAMSDRILAEIRAKQAGEVDPLSSRVADRYLETKLSPHQRGWEKRKEKDDFTEMNIPPEHLALWRKLKNQFKGTPDQRAEAFMEYVESHPGESDAVLQQNADKEIAKLQREQEKERREQVRIENECDKNQTRYEDAWYKEQERATKEKRNLQQLKEKADSVCQLCPTCDRGGEEMIPFAAALRVAARYELEDLLKQVVGGEPAIMVLVTVGGTVGIRVYPTETFGLEGLKALDGYLSGVLEGSGIEIYGPCKDDGGASLTYMVSSAWEQIREALEGKSWNGLPVKLLHNREPSSYPDAERHIIVVDALGNTMEAIEKVLKAIKNLGDVGHSTSVDIDGKAVAGVDGDGSDRIHQILIDGKDIDARVAARYKSKKKVETKDGDKVTVYEYSDRQIALRNRKKAERLEALKKNIGALRKRVQRDLKSSDPNTMLTALAVALIDHTYERVGNDDSADEGHFGVTGWQRKHITFGRGKATVRYVGKSGVKHEKKISDASILKALRDAYESSDEEEDSIFSHDMGKVDARKINSYLEPFEVSAKDLRGFHANREMQERLSATRSKGGKLPEDKKAREKQLKEEFKQALEEAAEAVGHEPSTLRSQYLVPGLEEAFLKDGTVPSKMKIAADAGGYTYDRT